MYSQKVDIARELTLQWPYLVCIMSTLVGTSDDETMATVSRTTQLLTGTRGQRSLLSHVTGGTQTTVATAVGAAPEIELTGQSASRMLAATW